MKINSSGTLQWVRRLASTTTGLSESYLNNVQVDPDNDDNILLVLILKFMALIIGVQILIYLH